jgi:hypothetical protein
VLCSRANKPYLHHDVEINHISNHHQLGDPSDLCKAISFPQQTQLTQIQAGYTQIVNGVTVTAPCPGILQLINQSSTHANYCCVQKTADLGFSICDSCSDDEMFATSTHSISCETIIPLTASNYEQLVSSASQSIARATAASSVAVTSTTASPKATGGIQAASSSSSTSINVSQEGSSAHGVVMPAMAGIVGLLFGQLIVPRM